MLQSWCEAEGYQEGVTKYVDVQQILPCLGGNHHGRSSVPGPDIKDASFVPKIYPNTFNPLDLMAMLHPPVYR